MQILVSKEHANGVPVISLSIRQKKDKPMTFVGKDSWLNLFTILAYMGYEIPMNENGTIKDKIEITALKRTQEKELKKMYLQLDKK